jgi:hypothetical protein
MDVRTLLLSLLCCAALVIAGCTSPAGNAAPATPAPVTAVQAAPTPMNAMGCTLDSDCVPAQCCHPTSCINRVAQKDCSGTACTMSCEGPLDCGAGSCRCVQGTCSVVAAQQETPVTTVPATTKSAPPVRIWATPQRYSPIMSSTPGLELSVIMPVMDTSTVVYDWTASYGSFLSWNPPDYAVNQKGSSVTTNGGKIYWSFTDKPVSTESPVTITMVARDVATGSEIGRSTLTLDWDGDTAVTVKKIS